MGEGKEQGARAEPFGDGNPDGEQDQARQQRKRGANQCKRAQTKLWPASAAATWVRERVQTPDCQR